MKTFEVFVMDGHPSQTIKADNCSVFDGGRIEFRNNTDTEGRTELVACFNFWAWFKVVDGPEEPAGLRELLEAKDCIVRSAKDIKPSEADSTGPEEQRPPFQPA